MAYIGGELEEGNEVAGREDRGKNWMRKEQRWKGEKRRRKKEARWTKRKKESERGRRERERKKKRGERKRENSGPLSRRLLSVWPALPALRAPDGTLLKFIDNHKFRK